MKRIIYGILAVVIIAGATVVLMAIADTIAKRELYVRPADYIVPKHQTEYDRKIGPALTPPPVDMAFLRSLEPIELTDKILRFEYEDNETGNYDSFGYTVEKLDMDKLDTTKPYVRPLALGIARPDVPERDSIVSENIIYDKMAPAVYYGFNREKLKEDDLEKIQDIQSQLHVNINDLKLQIVYDVQNLKTPRHISSDLYDSTTLARLSDGASWSNREQSPFEVAYRLHTYHPAQLRWMVDIAYGPCDYIDIPLEKGREAIFADAAFRLITDPFMAYCNSWSDTKFGFSDSNKKNQNVVIAMSPRCMSRLFTVQFLDKDRKPIGYEKGVCQNWHIDLVSNYGEEEGEYLRIYHYAGIKRFVLDIGKLPGTPEANDNVNNLMNVEIPYVYAEDGGMVNSVIRKATQLSVDSNVGYGTKMPQSQYYDITPLELLQEIQKVSPSGDKIRVELENGKVVVGEPVKSTFWQNFKSWLDKIF